MENRVLKMRTISPIMFLFGVATVLGIWMGDVRVIERLTSEDGIIETLSAVFYFFGFAVCIYCLVKKLPGSRFLLFLWAFLCFVFMGEELSWFQRIFGYPTPSVIGTTSAQKEFNIHNLEFFQGGKWIEALSSSRFNLKLFLSSQNIFRIWFVLYFLIVPLLLYAGKPKGIVKLVRDKMQYPLPGADFLVSVWATLILSFVFAIYSNEARRSALGETREMFYALFILAHVYMHLKARVTANTESQVKLETVRDM